MSSSLFLDDTALVELTGRRQRAKQVAWLRDRRWRFERNAQGRVLVAHAYLNRRMVGGDEEAAIPTATAAAPDFAAIAPRG